MRKFFLCLCVILIVFSITNGSMAATQTEKIKIGLVTYDLTICYQRVMIESAQKKADELGIDLIVLSSDWDAAKHLDIIDDFITMGIDGFISGSDPDPGAVAPGIKKLNEAGIPIIDLDNAILGGTIDYYIGFDLQETSARSAETMVQGIKNKHNGQVPSGVVIEVMGELIEGFASECSKGFHSVIDKYDQLLVVQGDGQWNNDDAFRVTSDYLTRFADEVVAIYCHTPDCMGAGTVNAVRAAGLNPIDFLISGICIGPEGIELLQKEELYCSAEQPMDTAAEMAVELLYKLITKQGDLPKIGDVITEERALWSPAEVVRSPYAEEGAYIKLRGARVPQDTTADDPRLWENWFVYY